MIAASIGVGDVVVYVIAGAIIGALARLIVPGKQSVDRFDHRGGDPCVPVREVLRLEGPKLVF